MWLLGTTLLGWMSGWFKLQRTYDPPAGEPLLELRDQRGSMGMMVGFRGTLRLTAYRSGLGIAVSRFRGPLQRPFLVPWSEIKVRSANSPLEPLHLPMVRLRLGNPKLCSLKIEAKSWSRLMQSVGVLESTMAEC